MAQMFTAGYHDEDDMVTTVYFDCCDPTLSLSLSLPLGLMIAPAPTPGVCDVSESITALRLQIYVH